MSGLADHSRYSRENLPALLASDAQYAKDMRISSDLLRDEILREFAAMRRRRIG